MKHIGVIIPAAGSGMRYGADKLWVELDGHPAVWYTLSAFQRAQTVRSIVVVARADALDRFCALAEEFSKIRAVVCGADTRSGSVRHGLEALPEDTQIVSIHDAARPLITPEEIDRIHSIAETEPALCVGCAVYDTVHAVDEQGFVIGTPDRKSLFAAQTPQVFNLNLYRAVSEETAGAVFSDDTAMFRAAGKPVRTVLCQCENFKITKPEDALRAERVLQARSAERSE